MVYKYKVISSNRNAIFSLCETSWESHFRPDVTSFFVGWCIYENVMSFLPRPWAGQKAGFRVMLKYFEIKKTFRYYIKQIDSMLPCFWFSNRSQKTSKCGKNISDTLGYASCATFLFLPHFDVICDLLLNRRTHIKLYECCAA